jgi:CheY-like chemotaxis protein
MTSVTQRKKKIFIADDDQDICESLATIIEDAGYDVDYVSDRNPLDKINKVEPDLILLDIWMSGIDGGMVCKFIKSNPKTKNIPVILISANNETEKIANKVGADGFVTKPFDIDYLLKVVNTYTNPL